MLYNRSFWIALLSCVPLLVGCADMTVLRTKEIRKVESDLRGRLDSLQAAIDTLQMEQERASRRLQAELSVLQRAMREGTDVLAARIEESSYALEQLRLNASSPQSTAVSSAVPKKESRKSASAKVVIDTAAVLEAELSLLYSTARADFNAQNYREAFQNFKEVYERSPAGVRAEDAMYWMGLCYERTGQAEHAATVYQQLLSVFPQGKKSCSARFQLARIAQDQQKTEERLRLLQELVAEPACATSNEGRRAAELLSSP